MAILDKIVAAQQKAREEAQPAPVPNAVPVEPRSVVYTWDAPQRYFRKIEKNRYIFILACVVALSVLLVLLGQFWFMAAIASVMFLLYVLGTVEPVTVSHIITNRGIESGESVFPWDSMKDYWFSKRDEQAVLNVDMHVRFPGRLILLVDQEQMKRVHELLRERLEYLDLRKQGRMSKILDGLWVDPATV